MERVHNQIKTDFVGGKIRCPVQHEVRSIYDGRAYATVLRLSTVTYESWLNGAS